MPLLGRLSAALRWAGKWAEDLRTVGNPYAVRDMRSRVRGLRFPGLLLAYHAIVVGIAAIALAVYAANRSFETPAGRFVFPYLAYTQLVLAPVVSAVLTATSVTAERERQTLDLVVMTPLRGLEIAVGKLAVPWGLTMLVACTSAPYAILAMVGGGVGFGSVVLLYVGLALFCGITASFGLLMSVVSRSSSTAVIATLVAYIVCLFAGLAANGLLAVVAFGGMPGGGPTSGVEWPFGPYMYLFPTTWGTGTLAIEPASCHVFGQPVPFWLPGIVIWGLLGAYMALVASCRVSLARARHLMARRLLGLLSWAAVLTALFGGSMPQLLRGGGTGAIASPALDVLALAGTLAAAAGSIAALQGGLGDCPDLWRQPLRTVLTRALAFWRVLRPRPESALALGLIVWAIAAGLPFLGYLVLTGTPMPSGYDALRLAALLIPQVFCVTYAALVGLWANGRFPEATNARRNAAAGRLVPLIAWPLLLLSLTTAIAGPMAYRSTTAAEGVIVMALYLAALSPISHPVLLDLSAQPTGVAAGAWIDIGSASLHPFMVCLVVSVGLAAAAFVGLTGRWRANAEWLRSQSYAGDSAVSSGGTRE